MRLSPYSLCGNALSAATPSQHAPKIALTKRFSSACDKRPHVSPLIMFFAFGIDRGLYCSKNCSSSGSAFFKNASVLHTHQVLSYWCESM